MPAAGVGKTPRFQRGPGQYGARKTNVARATKAGRIGKGKLDNVPAVHFVRYVYCCLWDRLTGQKLILLSFPFSNSGKIMRRLPSYKFLPINKKEADEAARQEDMRNEFLPRDLKDPSYAGKSKLS